MGCGKSSSLSKLLLIRISHGPAVTYATQAATAGSAEPMACTARACHVGRAGAPQAGRRARGDPVPMKSPSRGGEGVLRGYRVNAVPRPVRQ